MPRRDPLAQLNRQRSHLPVEAGPHDTALPVQLRQPQLRRRAIAGRLLGGAVLREQIALSVKRLAGAAQRLAGLQSQVKLTWPGIAALVQSKNALILALRDLKLAFGDLDQPSVVLLLNVDPPQSGFFGRQHAAGALGALRILALVDAQQHLAGPN